MRVPILAVGVGAALAVTMIHRTPAALDQRQRAPQEQGEPARQGHFPAQEPGGKPAGGGPWNHDVLVCRVTPNGEAVHVATFEGAGVATIARMKDGRLIAAHQHFPENNPADFDKVAVRFSSDEGNTWTAPKVIRVQGLPEGMRFPFDPTLVTLPDGRVRLYFTGNMARRPGTPAIHSAISTDGVNYTYEPGVRFAVEGRAVIDCAVALHNGVFHLYAPDNGARVQPGRPPLNRPAAEQPREGVGYHATSTDGLNFKRADDVRIEGRRRWLGNAISDGKAITFFGTGEGEVWIGVSTDGQQFELVRTLSIPVADPGAVPLPKAGWIMVGTGPPVRGPRAGGPPGFGQPQRPGTQPGPGARPSASNRSLRESGFGPRKQTVDAAPASAAWWAALGRTSS